MRDKLAIPDPKTIVNKIYLHHTFILSCFIKNEI